MKCLETTDLFPYYSINIQFSLSLFPIQIHGHPQVYLQTQVMHRSQAEPPVLGPQLALLSAKDLPQCMLPAL